MFKVQRTIERRGYSIAKKKKKEKIVDENRSISIFPPPLFISNLLSIFSPALKFYFDV